MEIVDIVLSILASALSIAATVIAYKSKKEVDGLRELYKSNELSANGNGNAQVVGTGNRVNTYDR